MDPNQKKMLVAVGSVFGVVVIVLAVLLFRQFSAMQEARQGREDAGYSLDACYRVTPYPNAANLRIREADAKAYSDWADRARGLLTRSGDVLNYPEGETPSQFLDRLHSVVRTLNGRQQADALALYGINPATLGNRTGADGETAVTDFSFGRYVTQGEMPVADHVARLARQFAAIEFVSTLLYDKGALYISEVTRETFDEVKQAEPEKNTRTARRRRTARTDAPPAAAAAAGVPELLAKDGVTRECYSIRFQARYRTLVEVLNTLAETTDVFFVIDDLTVNSHVNIRARVDDRVKKRESALRTARLRAERRGEKVESDAGDGDQGLFAGASPAERLVSDPDPERATPLDVTMKFEIWTAPAPEAPETAEVPATQEGV